MRVWIESAAVRAVVDCWGGSLLELFCGRKDNGNIINTHYVNKDKQDKAHKKKCCTNVARNGRRKKNRVENGREEKKSLLLLRLVFEWKMGPFDFEVRARELEGRGGGGLAASNRCNRLPRFE